MGLNLVLELESRSPGHSHVTRARQSGKVPGVFYGHQDGPVLVQVSQGALLAALDQGAEHHPTGARRPDGTNLLAIVKEVQWDPVTHKPVHVDFMLVTQDEKVTVTVPVVLHGENDLLRRGLAPHIQIHQVNVHGPALALPDAVEVEAGNLQLGDTVLVGDLKLAPGVSISENASHVVFSVARSHRMHDEPETATKPWAPVVSPGPQDAVSTLAGTGNSGNNNT
ncbi:MAG TPA: 50S ribosomal protein L25 [Symbiobacteriaceae bacterium]|jgi:large subunit ribosomal protein L25